MYFCPWLGCCLHSECCLDGMFWSCLGGGWNGIAGGRGCYFVCLYWKPSVTVHTRGVLSNSGEYLWRERLKQCLFCALISFKWWLSLLLKLWVQKVDVIKSKRDGIERRVSRVRQLVNIVLKISVYPSPGTSPSWRSHCKCNAVAA